MKSIGRLVIAAAVLFILSVPCYTQRRVMDEPGWEGTHWGMSEAEIVSVFSSRLKKLPQRKEFLRQYVDYVIPEFKLEGETYTIFFQMDIKTGKLSQVLIRLNEQKARSPQVDAFNSLASSLKKQYSEPDSKRDNRYSFGIEIKGIELSQT